MVRLSISGRLERLNALLRLLGLRQSLALLLLRTGPLNQGPFAPRSLLVSPLPYGPLRLPPPPGSDPHGPPVARAFPRAREWISRVDAPILGTHVDATTPAA